MDDVISRKAAIDALTKDKASIDRIIKNMSGYKKEFGVLVSQRNQVEYDINAINGLPSAQPEIIFCKDCIHSDIYPKGADYDMPLKCLGIRYGGVMPDWYCEHAERRA